MFQPFTRSAILTFLMALFTHHAQADDFTVGYLLANYEDFYVTNRNMLHGATISGAMTMAVNDVNKNDSLLKGHTLRFQISNTQGDTLIGTKVRFIEGMVWVF